MEAKKPKTGEEDVSHFIETVSGRRVNPSAPSADDICVHDIAWALSRIPRFAGHTITEVSYNVAQHSIYVSELVERLHSDPSIMSGRMSIDFEHAMSLCPNVKTLALKALFHDGHEAYFGDIPSPIKKIPALTQTFKDLETGLDEAIFGMLGLNPVMEHEKLVIKYCDKLAQAIESYQFMPSRGRNWDLPQPTLTLLQKFPHPIAPLKSYQAFLDRFEYLSGP